MSKKASKVAHTLENLLFQARWILSPLYVGLVFALIALIYRFILEFIHLIQHLGEKDPHVFTLDLLALLDLTLIGNLILIVILAGYENFVSRLELKEETEKLSWLGTLDTTTLKSKVAASIVAISSIHLLKIFVNANNVDNDKLLWFVVMHLTFVASAVAMGLLDKATRKH